MSEASDAEAHAVWSEVDLDAIRANVRALRDLAAPAELLAVVKANGYGHGAVPVARAALDAGATWLGVARVDEGVQLRAAGIDAPIMLLSEPAPRVADRVVAHGSRRSSTPSRGSTRWRRPSPTPDAPSRSPCTSRSTPACTASAALPTKRWRWPRTSPRVTSSPSPACARTSPSPTSPGTRTPPTSSAGSTRCSTRSAARGLRPPLAHAANSAALLTDPRARYDLVRIGIACYGLPPRPCSPTTPGSPCGRRSRCGPASPW